MKCVFLDCDTLGQDTDLSVITELMETSCFNNTQKKNEIIIERLQNADAVISNKVPIRQEVIEACPQLKVIFTAATGVDHIDTAFAAKRNIPVCNTRNYAGPSVVQHVMASILYFANKQHEYNASITDRTWSQQELFCLFTPAITELAGKTLGIIGYGNLGKQVASVAKAFGMQIKVAESFSNKQEDTDRFPLSEILSTSDFISLHCPLTEQTKYLFHKKTFEQMKSNAVLINTARGDIVDTNALLEALDSNLIAGASLDVFNQEPLPLDSPLIKKRQNLLLTPHIAWASYEARTRLIGELVANIRAWLNNDIRNAVNI
ncbi:MAG: D-2-hydroxyacid dehydrogenase [Pseudomonadota bacterium]|nr:D-2-hydroxyacid dehydrogenase [Pseudomonadota bacterium]